ncbi:MAG TPA: sugar phosphate isomerase/epimerase family protein [Candidatus Hydrogenedentes bacterium]|nr:sugar phosphate isomerase/epimerase family protein [Candidatus Hydrogenedentota bacterium]HQM50227.1 sugar phosphate isomerase/epimerase family protein [Candidatus Hydrogenedentota bacterium]
MADIQVGLNTEAFRHADKPLEYSLAAIRKQGYRYCELNMLNGRDLLSEAGYYGAVSMERDPLEVKGIVDSFGLKVSAVSAHAPMAQPEVSIPFLTRAIEYADALGATCVCTDEGVVPGWMSKSQAFNIIYYTLRRVLPAAERHKVHIALEPHQKYSVKLNTYLEILNLVESPYMNCNPDTGNIFMAGQDPYEFLEAIAKRVVHVHAKDIGGVVMGERGKVTGVPSGCACGEGVLDWRRIVKILRKAGFKGVLSVECSTEEQGLASIKHLSKVLRAK